MKKKIFCTILAIVLLLNISVVFATETNEEEDLILTMNDSIEELTNVPLVSSFNEGKSQVFNENKVLSDENVNFEDATINGNLIIFGKNVNLQNVRVNGDVAIFAQTIEISSVNVTNGATVIAGQDLNLNMLSSSGNIYTAGQNITGNVIANGLYVAAADVKLGNESQISKLYNYSGDLSLDGGSYGTVEANIENLHIGSNTIISNNLKYSSGSEGIIDASAQVANVEYTEVETDIESEVIQKTKDAVIKEKIRSVIAFVVKTAIVCGFIFLFATGFINKTKTEDSVKYIALSALKGLGWTLLVPIIAFVLLVSGLGIGTSLVVLAIYTIIFWASVPLVSVVIMNMVTKNMPEDKWKKYGITLLIAIVIGILKKVPVLGGLVSLFVGFAGMGIFFNCLKQNKTKNDEIKVDIVKEKVEEVNENESEK